MRKGRVYCSGPLFNEKEREEMEEVAAALDEAGFETFLPHRDGFEFAPLLPRLMELGVPHEEAHALWERAIFALDVFQVARGCDAIVVNLNGRVPDEGAVAEAAIAWSLGKLIVGMKNDARSLYWGRDNPLVAGLFRFRLCPGPGAAAEAVRAGWIEPAAASGLPLTSKLGEVVLLGERLWLAKALPDDLDGVARILRETFPSGG